MAMLIAWQTINAVRRPGSRKFTRGFLVVTPGVTIRERLRVPQPNDPDSYSHHAFLRRETLPVSKGGRALLQGSGPELRTKETEGQVLQRVMPGLRGMKRILALNDEAHHCYGEKPAEEGDEGPLKGRRAQEAERNGEATRVWIAGLEAVQQKLGLPPVPVADNIPGGEMPKFRNLWEHIRPKMPKRGRGKAGRLDPLSLPVELQTALEALYGHYEKTFESWQNEGIQVPPCFIVVCNNTSTSKLVHDFIAGFSRENEDGCTTLVNGRLPLFRNFDEHGNRLACPHTLLIDSEQLDSGEALDKNFRAAARATRSRDSAGSESSRLATARRPSISPTRICSAR